MDIMMNNRTKNNRWITALLLSAMILSGCGSTADNTDTPKETASAGNSTPAVSGETESESETEPERPSDGLEDVNMDGFSMTFLSYDGTQYWWSRNQIDAEEMTAEPVNDAIYERNTALETRFNAQIQEKKVASVQGDLNRDVLAGVSDYQVAMVNDQAINSCLVAGSLLM